MSGHPIGFFANEECNRRDTGGNHSSLTGSDGLHLFTIGAIRTRCRVSSAAIVRARLQSCRMRRQPAPSNNSCQAKLIDIGRFIIRDAPRQDETLPRVCGNFESLQLTDYLERAVLAAHLGTGSDVLPAQQPIHELRRGYGLDLLAEGSDCQAMNASKKAALPPFGCCGFSP